MKSRNLLIIVYFNNLVQQIIPENSNFGLCAFSASFTYQNVQICNVWLFSRTYCCHGNLIGTPAEYYLGFIVLFSTNQNWVILLSKL